MTELGMGDLPRRAAEYSRDEMVALLGVGAQWDRHPGTAAAVHLLTCTDLPGRNEFAAHVGVHGVWEASGSTTVGAWVDWEGLACDGSLRLSESARRVLEIAASYGVGRPVDLRASMRGLGAEYARGVAEAALIAAGAGDVYGICEPGR